MIYHLLGLTDEEKHLDTNLCNRSRPNWLNIEAFKDVIKILAELLLHNLSDHIKWCGWCLITQGNKPLHPSHGCQIGLTQYLSRLFIIIT
jgi:hypothetical protein